MKKGYLEYPRRIIKSEFKKYIKKEILTQLIEVDYENTQTVKDIIVKSKNICYKDIINIKYIGQEKDRPYRHEYEVQYTKN